MNPVAQETPADRLYTCRKCGLESRVKELYLERKSLFGAQKTTCRECEQKEGTHLILAEFWIFLVGSVFFLVLAPGSGFGQLCLVALAALLSLIPFIVLHELAHAGVGALLGFRVYAVHLGFGNVFYSMRFLGVQWVLHVMPMAGLTVLAAPEGAHYRLRMFLMVLAGPAVHLLTLVVLFWLAPFFNAGSPVLDWPFLWNMLVFVNLLLLITNLNPRTVSPAPGTVGSDGFLLLKLLRMPREELRQFYSAYYALGALAALDEHEPPAARQWAAQGLALYPENDMLLNVSGVVYTYSAEHEKARQAYLQVLAREGLSNELKYLAMNNVAYSNLLLEDASLLGQADDYSMQALKNLPLHPAVVGTRGAVLVALGQVEPGLALLERALKKSPEKRSKAQLACSLALGELKRGRRAEAQRYLDAARRFDPRCLLLARVTQKMETEG